MQQETDEGNKESKEITENLENLPFVFNPPSRPQSDQEPPIPLLKMLPENLSRIVDNLGLFEFRLLLDSNKLLFNDKEPRPKGRGLLCC